MGSEAGFLEWNKDNIFKNLIQAEGHYRNLEAGFSSRGEFLSCITKHLAYAESEAEEAVSHSLMVEGSERSQEYGKMMNSIRELRKRIQTGSVSAEEGIREVRKIRASFEKLNPPFDTSKCRSCGSSEEILEKLKEILPEKEHNFKDMEATMAKQVLEDLSAKYGVEPPRLELNDRCHEPNEGYYQSGTISLCQGGVNLHVLLHEFKHYYDHKTGKPLDEREAEAFAVDTVEKGLYPRGEKHSHSEHGMESEAKDIGLVIGGVNLGWGIGQATKVYVDPAAPGSVMGQNPSLLVDVGGTILGIIGAFKLRRDALRKLAGYMAAGFTIQLWDDAAKMMPAAPVVRVIQPIQQGQVSIKPPAFVMANQGKYR